MRNLLNLQAGAAKALAMIAAMACAMLAGCASQRGGPVPYDVKGFGQPDTAASLTLEEGYRIAPLDVLKITVFQVDDLTGEYEVDLTGNVAVPLIGNVKAADLTIVELDQALTRKLGEKYLQSPDVSIGIKSSSTRMVTVDGAVRTPGVYPAPAPITLMQAIALASGTAEGANPRRIAIFRNIDGQRMAAAFDLTSIRRGQAEDPRVYSGDIVVVDGSNTKSIFRQVLSTLPVLSLFRPY